MNFIFCFFLTALIAGPAYARSPSEDVRELSQQEKSIIEAVVRDGLKDPESARFKWYPYNGYNHYCGLINAKNSYGGYNGYTHFYIKTELDNKRNIISASKFEIVDEAAEFGKALLDVCLIASRGKGWRTSPPVARP